MSSAYFYHPYYVDSSMDTVRLFLLLSVGGTAAWVYFLRHKPFQFLALAMFFPGAIALLLCLFKGTLFQFLSTAFALDSTIILYTLLFGGLQFIFVMACACINWLLGWGQWKSLHSFSSSAVHEHNRNLLMGYLRALGEELGWRSFLLPALLANFSGPISYNIVGLVWGAYHLPVMILLAFYSPKLNVAQPYRVISVQFVSCWFCAFVYNYFSALSGVGFSVFPASVAHFLWNRFNPFALGSIYTNTPGELMSGEQWLINGEGLSGCILFFFLALQISFII